MRLSMIVALFVSVGSSRSSLLDYRRAQQKTHERNVPGTGAASSDDNAAGNGEEDGQTHLGDGKWCSRMNERTAVREPGVITGVFGESA